MSEQKQTADNPNKDGAPQRDKFQYEEGDIEWIKPPRGVNAPAGSATAKKLSKGQARDLAKRIRAKLGKKD
jgi:hypothetical protein